MSDLKQVLLAIAAAGMTPPGMTPPGMTPRADHEREAN